MCDPSAPFQLSVLGSEVFVTTTSAAGHAFHVYKASDKLQLSLASPPVRHGIVALATGAHHTTWTALSNGEIVRWTRNAQDPKRLAAFRGHASSRVLMVPMSETQLVMVQGSTLKIYHGSKLHLELELPNDETFGAEATALMHPDTYLNKVLVASASGAMLLINVRVGSIVHAFPASTFKGVGITALEQSPAVDVVAVGLKDGRVVLRNIRFDEHIVTFRHAAEGDSGQQLPAVTSMSFRTTHDGRATMVSAADNGEIAVWDLSAKQLLHVMRDAHDGAVVRVAFLPAEPVMVSAGTDNALKMWIFDQQDGSARLLRSREGHQSPPVRVRFYPPQRTGVNAPCVHVLSASNGLDRSLRMFHVEREEQSWELSQGSLQHKASKRQSSMASLRLPDIVQFAATEARERDWSNIVTVHREQSAAFTWRTETRALGERILRPDARLGGLKMHRVRSDMMSAARPAAGLPKATCVAVSVCGNFVAVGMESGETFKYNLQSGMVRGAFPRAAEQRRAVRPASFGKGKVSLKLPPGSVDRMIQRSLQGAGGTNAIGAQSPVPAQEGEPHDGAVQGVGLDALGCTLVSAGLDGVVRLWNFLNGKALVALDMGTPISLLEMARGSDLVAVVGDDLHARIIDSTTRRVVRTLKGHKARVTDMTFSGDGRWLVTASVDASVRVWDLPTARCVEWLRFREPVTSLSLAPSGEFLATTHVDRLGVYLWANQAHFGTARADQIVQGPVDLELPGVGAAGEEDGAGNGALSSSSSQPSSSSLGDASPAREEQLPAVSFTGATAFSGQAASRWYTLARLALIKERNKPIEPPTKPVAAPFFLPALGAAAAPGSSSGGDSATVATAPDAPPPPEGLASAWDEDEGDDDQAGDTVVPLSRSKILHTTGFSRPRTALLRALETCHAQSELTKEQYATSDVMDEDSDDESESAVVRRELGLAVLMADDFTGMTELLGNMSPSAVEFELASLVLGPEDEDGSRLLGQLVDWMVVELRAGTNFEMVQGVMSRVLELHHEVIVQRPELLGKLRSLLEAQRGRWLALHGLLQQNLCLVQFMSRLQ